MFSRRRLIPVKYTYEQKKKNETKNAGTNRTEQLKNVSSADRRDLAQSVRAENRDRGLKRTVFLQTWMISSRIYFYSTLESSRKKKKVNLKKCQKSTSIFVGSEKALCRRGKESEMTLRSSSAFVLVATNIFTFSESTILAHTSFLFACNFGK